MLLDGGFMARISNITASLAIMISSPTIATQAASESPNAERPRPMVLTEGTVISPAFDDIENGVVVTQGKQIVCVGGRSDCEIPADSEIQDMRGKFILPGLIDAHVHLSFTGWLDTRPDSVDVSEVYPYEQTIAALRSDPARWHRSYLCSGVTAVFDLGGAKWTVTGAQATDTDRDDRAHVVSTGMLLTPLQAANSEYARGSLAAEPIFLPFESDDDVRAGLANLKEIGAGAVKVWFLAVPEDRRSEMEERLVLTGKLAEEAGLPLVVHATDLRDAKAALRAGASVLAHSVTDVPVDQEFLDLLIEKDATYIPTLLVIQNWRKALASAKFGSPLEVDDPNRCVDEEALSRIGEPQLLTRSLEQRKPDSILDRLVAEGRTQAIVIRNLVSIRDAGGRIALGTDAGNPLTLHGPGVLRELEAMQLAGLTAAEIIKAATFGGARAMGLEHAIGSLEAGKIADLIVLEDDPRTDVRNFRSLVYVMRNGVLRSQSELRVR